MLTYVLHFSLLLYLRPNFSILLLSRPPLFCILLSSRPNLLLSSLFFSSPYFTFFLYFHHLNIFLLVFLFYSSSFIYNSILPCFLTSLRNSPGSSFPTSSLPGRVTQSVNILVRVHSPYSQPIHLSIY